MITKEQAMALSYGATIHRNGCNLTVGPRGGITVRIEEWRKSGQVKLWKTRPSDFRMPIKYGLYQSNYLDHNNACYFHLPENCPLEPGGPQ